MRLSFVSFLTVVGGSVCDAAFRQDLAFVVPRSNRVAASTLSVRPRLPTSRVAAVEIGYDESEFEDVEPGKMRVSEIKSELEMRGVDYSDCIDKESLADKLRNARASGKADPSILDEFNKKRLEDTYHERKAPEIKDEDIDKALANDGTLPGGMSPEMLKKLTSNPELMAMLQNTKMQEAMKLTMTGGQEALEKAMAQDPEIREILRKLNQLMMESQ